MVPPNSLLVINSLKRATTIPNFRPWATSLPSYILMLEKQDLIKRTDDDKFVLVRNLSQVDFWSFYSNLPYSLPHKHDIGDVLENDEWMEKIGPALIEADDYLSAKL